MVCSRCDKEFRQHLPTVLLIHVSAISREDVYPENNRGGTDEIPHWIQSTAYGKTNPIYTYSGCPWIVLDNSKGWWL